MARAFLFILDSFGIGGAPDAAEFSDLGSNTLGNIAFACNAGHANKLGVRSGKLVLPNMEKLGLGYAAKNASGVFPDGFDETIKINGVYANASEISKGKDTPSGHWEIAGVPVTRDWHYFPDKIPAFPKALTDKIISENDLPGFLGNCHASGTQIIADLGEEHIKSGKPIFYTSSDSVFQIAAHEDHFGLDKLYLLCEQVFKHTSVMNVGRVIARPFTGSSSADFSRTGNRKDFSIRPPEATLLERISNCGRQMIAVGKIADIYAHIGPTESVKANGNAALGSATLSLMDGLKEGGMLMTNFVDFDMLYGHRRDVIGYANALEQFDRLLPEFFKKMRADDLLIITADHGCDPTWQGTDHTREQVPVLVFSKSIKPADGGARSSFCDIGETIAKFLGIEKGKHGTPIEIEFVS